MFFQVNPQFHWLNMAVRHDVNCRLFAVNCWLPARKPMFLQASCQ
jgi:hypothetical protein